ncbi:MAG: dTDP-4-dehydrorhamnose reductase [candidate division WOR-3 bacterium]|nr:MAG: dTDP-4-dehydrorhamnose reductase [candidate division WOR-3 bacterium]
MKVFMSGAEGALGKEMTALLRHAKVKFLPTDIKQLDITDFKKTSKVISDYRPDVILHFAAVSDVDSCETDRDTAYRVNALSTLGLAVNAKRVGAKMLYTSTNFVFSGDSESPYSENCQPNPISEYGRTKLFGENYVREICDRYYIVRTAWLFGLNSKTFISKFLSMEKKPRAINVVCDQFGSLTYIPHLGEAILRIIKSDNYGTYHIVNSGVASWLDLVLRAKKIMRFRTTIRPVKTEELGLPAKRPRYAPLSSNNYEFLFSCSMKSWEDALTEYIKRLMRKP